MLEGKWKQYFLHIADAVASNSPCLSRHVGAVIVRGKHIVSTGYNGPPASYPHCPGTVCPRQLLGYKSGEAIHLCPAAHAERNAIDIAALLGYSTEGCTMVLNTSVPCAECAKSIVNAGIRQLYVTSRLAYELKGITGYDILISCGIVLEVI